jgi:hypothetical protein
VRSLRCFESQEANPGLPGSSCARACGARKGFFSASYGTTEVVPTLVSRVDAESFVVKRIRCGAAGGVESHPSQSG